MRKTLFLLLLTTVLWSSCTSVSKDDIQHLKGYWEIASVASDGEVFQPKGAPPSVDFYQMINDSLGTKKKLVPSFGEKYSGSEDEIDFRVIKKEGKYFIQFFNALEEWEEEITKLNTTELILLHSEKSYHYKRHQKITL